MPASDTSYFPETFCSDWTGLATRNVECRNGYRLDTLAPAPSKNAAA